MCRGHHGVLHLLLTVGLTACGDAARKGGFDAQQARSLIPEAAGAAPDLLEELAELGAAMTDEDMLARGTAPLSQLLCVLNPAATPQDPGREVEVLEDWWHALRSQVTTRDLLDRMGPPAVRRAGGQGTYVTLLRAECLREVSVTRAGDAEASGVVRFECGDEYGGRVEWTARRGSTGWRIEEFRLPGRRIRLRLLDGLWVPEDEQHPSVLPWRRFNLEFALTRTDVPRAGAVSPMPPPGIEIGVREYGELECWALRRRIQFTQAAFGEVARAHRESDGTCALDVVLRVHSDAPWGIVERIFRTLQDPQVLVYRTFMAVATEDGTEEGVLPCFLPKGAPVGPVGSTVPAGGPLRVRLEADANAMDWGKAQAALRRHLTDPAKSVVTLRAAPTIATGDVVRVLDLLRREGAGRIDIVEPQAGEQADSGPTWPATEDARRLRLAEDGVIAGFKLEVGTETILGAEPAVRTTPGGRRR
jgi:hypothetical protein